jgi:hypothetical protein
MGSHQRLATNFHVDAFVPVETRHRGCRIVWDTRRTESTIFWTGKVAVVLPENTNMTRVHKVYQSDCFLSEADARDHLIGAAKQWIDNRLESGNSHES